jgi:Cytochrome P450
MQLLMCEWGVAFRLGRRDCAGQNFARVSYLTTMARLLGNFHFRLADRMGGPEGVLATQRMAVTLQPAKGLWMHCEPRVPT